MTLDQWNSRVALAYRRARALEGRLKNLANIARGVGCDVEAYRLEIIAARVMPCADRVVDSLSEQFAKAA